MHPTARHSPGLGKPRQSLRGSLSRKYSLFTGFLLTWVIFIFFAYDLGREGIDIGKVAIMSVAVFFVAAAILRFTNRLLAKPLRVLQEGVTSVRQGNLESVPVCPTGDEIEYLGDSLNELITALKHSRNQIRVQNEMLEERIRQRTEALEVATHKALAASRAKSEFLANMSHELRTPMSGVLGMIDIVLDDNLTADQRENLEAARGCANTLLALLNDILDLSKIEAGKMIIERIPFDLRNLAVDCAHTMQPRCREKGVALLTEIDGAVPGLVVGDPLRIRQVLTNLLSNAVKFTDHGSVRIQISPDFSREDPSLLIRVIDTGSGIPAAKLETIFDEFTQADGSISRKYGGTGLGLAITRRLVEMHGGTIKVESEVGRGSRFTVCLALQTPAQPATGKLEGGGQAENEPAAATARILLAEDNPVNQKVTVAVLEKHGFQVRVADNGRQALEILSLWPCDLVLMDVQMPELDGVSATKEIRKNPAYANLPVIAVTAHAMKGDREHCLAAGMNDYLSKPVSSDHLMDVISRHLHPKPDVPAGIASENGADAEERDLAAGTAMLFFQLAPDRIKELYQAAARNDRGALGQLSERLETGAERIAAPQIAALARRVREASLQEQTADVHAPLLELERELLRFEQELRAEATSA